MNDRRTVYRTLILSVFLTTCVLLLSFGNPLAAQGQGISSSSSTKKTAMDLKGIWSGTLYSKHTDVAPFTLTVDINPDASGHLVGTSTLSSDCLKGAKLRVTAAGSNVVLAGSDEDGNNITVRGTVDAAGTLLHSRYILNGSATGRCETDDGSGDLLKR